MADGDRDQRVAFAVCEWLAQLAESRQQADPDAAESAAVAQDVLQSGLRVDLSDAAQASRWSLKEKGGLGAVLAASETSGESASDASASSSAGGINATEAKFGEYLRVVAGRNFFGDHVPGSAEYEERYQRARSKFLEKHAPAGAPSTNAASFVPRTVPAADKAKAEQKKVEGNQALGAGQAGVAAERYTEAIEFDDTVAVYFANRAAAFSHLGEHEKAIADCDEAIRRDPTYAKAHGRKGLAYFSLNKFAESVAAYEKAAELEPQNDSVLRNLEAARAKLPAASSSRSTTESSATPDGASTATAPAGGMPDIGSMLGSNPNLANLASMFGGAGGGGGGSMPDMSDPAFAQMASQAMQNPQLMAMAQQMMSDPQALQQMMGMLGGRGGQ